MKNILLFLLFALCSFSVFAEELSGRAMWIYDGDTFVLNADDGKYYNIRLYGLDAPEKAQDYGIQASGELIKLIGRKRVRVEVIDTDKYGRKVCKVYTATKNPKYINILMIKNGAAWHYKQYSKDEDLAEAETSARKAQIGLWEPSDDGIPLKSPWQFRHDSKGVNHE